MTTGLDNLKSYKMYLSGSKVQSCCVITYTVIGDNYTNEMMMMMMMRRGVLYWPVPDSSERAMIGVRTGVGLGLIVMEY